MREPPAIPQERLHACLQEQYGLSPVTLEFLPRGGDFQAGVYRVVSEQGTPYLLKVTSRPLYEPGCLVPGYLREEGITSVVAPVPTRSHALWTKLTSWLVIVYPFHEGETSVTGMTNEQWKEVGAIFRQIHQVRVEPVSGLPLRKETFDPTEYSNWIRAFETHYLHTQDGGDEYTCALRASWLAHQSTIHTAVTFLEKLAELLRSRTFPYVICHADLHPANLIRNRAGHVFVIDWDEVMLAPRERDFIFIRKPAADAFWKGYGKREIDWTALTYYLWERVVQDVIADAQDVCFRDGLGEETRADITRIFSEYLARGADNLAAAYDASAHLTL